MSLRTGIGRPAGAAVFLAMAAAPALADTGFYFGATAGGSLYQQSKGDFDAITTAAFSQQSFSVTSGSSSLRRTDHAFGGLIGYRVTPQFSIEAAYIYLGKLHYTSFDNVLFQPPGRFGLAVTTSGDFTRKTQGPTLTALGILPLSPAWEIYGRAGLFFATTTLDASAVLNGSVMQNSGFPYGGFANSVSAHTVDPLVGVGAAWHVSSRIALRAEYTRFIDVGNKDTTGKVNIDLFNLGITYSLR